MEKSVKAKRLHSLNLAKAHKSHKQEVQSMRKMPKKLEDGELVDFARGTLPCSDTHMLRTHQASW